jgi:two-component system nitrate/nitrite response regulator NarL
VIVDDHSGFREQARRLLEGIGVRVVGEAGTGKEALSTIRSLKPDLVLLDIQLPDLDGFAVAAQLTSLVPSPTILLVSTRDAKDYGSRIETSGTAFIAKADLSADSLASLLNP